MQVDNSGPVVVFDKKTTEAIEAGKNQITLLQVEEQRLGKLVREHEAQLIKMGTDIEYKTTTLSVLDSSIEEQNKRLLAVGSEADKAQALAETINRELDARVAIVQDQETQVREKTTELNKREKALDKKEADLKEKEAQVLGDFWTIKDKKEKIDAFLKTL